MSGFDFKIDEGDNTYRVEMDLFDDTVREAFRRLARRQEEALEDGLKALGWMAPEDAEAMRDAVNQHDALVAFVEAVRELHTSAGEGAGEPHPIFGDVWLCNECDQNHPCDTAKALDELDAQIGGN